MSDPIYLDYNATTPVSPRVLADQVHAAGALMRVDAAQAAGKIVVDLDALGVAAKSRR